MPNALIHETSPYLLQHAHNPVNWYPWGEEALEKARTESKLILVSIGYAACHWCHVMERESFEDPEVAKVMNEHFVCIKVDREERPDVDKIYMDAVMLMTQRGGWPLNAIALPDRRPIYGGTYFPKDHWISVLKQVQELYENQPQRALEVADNLVGAMNSMDRVIASRDTTLLSEDELDKVLEEWMTQVDFKWGGRAVSANKFPLPVNNLFLLRAAWFTGHPKVAEAVTVTLEKMAFGGIFDHIGGGFARYSVDPYWKVPHFEKMLYDNGQLVSLYAEAWQQQPKELYRDVVYHTLDFVQREMTSPEGGFYSSLDADSEGVEGKYYLWDYEEFEYILDEDSKLFADYYNANPMGNWEGRNILFTLETESQFAFRWKLNEADFKIKMAECRQKLLAARAKRVRPGLDDKILTSWNALMLKGFVDAYRVFGEERFLQAALDNANFIFDKMTEGGKLYRNYKEGKRTISGFLDDYALVIDAYIALYQVTFEGKWLSQAQLHTAYVSAHFFDRHTAMFFYTSDEEEVLVRRKTEVQDDVIPSSNAVMAHNLHALGLLYGEPEYLRQMRQMLANMKTAFVESPAWHACWGLLALKQVFPFYEIAITGEKIEDFRKKMQMRYHPGRIFAGSTKESSLPLLKDRFQKTTRVYVCEEGVCHLPVSSVEEALAQME
ncbi:MAG: thioredoxin domain-containing protein [Bacteroidia bacterium]|nr:thioredoxin domain-containing protein [Bacteroidia bacterium]